MSKTSIHTLIKNKELIKSQLFINNQWTDQNSGNAFPVYNPYDGELLARVADASEEEALSAIEAADAALGGWKSLAAKERSGILRRWFDLILANKEDLATLLTLEQGKPLDEARGEIEYGASFIEWFAEEGKRVYGDTIPASEPGKRTIVLKQPVGVVAAITPWNFPNAMITRKVAPALAVGCTVVIKPSEETPLSALALAQLALEAGFPSGVLNVIPTTKASEVGTVLTKSDVVKKLSFTGSTAVGKLLMKQCADTVKKLSLELGGNAPFIIFNDADLDEAVAGYMASKYRNAGQTCVCANRLFVQSGIYDAFMQKLQKAVESLKTGSGLEDAVSVGPLINQKAIDKVKDLLSDAEQKGAELLTGGKSSGHGIFEPTIVHEVKADMTLHSEEIFGPVAAVYRFDTTDEVIAMANDTDVGLAGYFYSKDHQLIWKVAEALEYGMVGINTGIVSDAAAPFGGIKQSGFGREGSKYGLDDYLITKYLSIQV